MEIAPELKNVSTLKVDDDTFTKAFCKRLMIHMPLILIFGNTLASIFNLGKESATTPLYFDDGDSCDTGLVIGKSIVCEYTTHPTFQLVLIVWIVYFFGFLVVSFFSTMGYRTNDLRFYLATDYHKRSYLNKVFCYLGMLLTFASACTAIYYMVAVSYNTASIGTVFVFLFLNCNVFYKQTSLAFEKINDLDFKTSFPEPIYFQFPKDVSFSSQVMIGYKDVPNMLVQKMASDEIEGLVLDQNSVKNVVKLLFSHSSK
jgi:hypothetical protein